MIRRDGSDHAELHSASFAISIEFHGVLLPRRLSRNWKKAKVASSI
jgi:hypothetical protein